MPGSWRTALALAAAAAALAACGGGSGNQGEGAKSPQQIAQDAAVAASKLHSFRLDGTIRDAQGSGRLTAEVIGRSRAHITLRRPSSVLELITIGPHAYLRASRSYYAALPGLTSAQVIALANRWVKFATAANPQTQASITRGTDIGLEARCWAGRRQGLSVAGTGSVDGRAAVIVANDGSAPGSAPGKVWVATTGPPWPLRSVITGPRKPGGTGACAISSTDRTSDVTISAFNQPIHLAAPPAALDLQTFNR